MFEACCFLYPFTPRWNIFPRQVGGWQHVLLLCLHARLSPVFPVAFPQRGVGRAKMLTPGGRTGWAMSWSGRLALAGKISPGLQDCRRALESFKQNKNKPEFLELMQSLCSLCTLCSTRALYFLPCSVGPQQLSSFTFLFSLPGKFITGIVYDS